MVRRQLMGKRICPICGKVFVPDDYRAITCSRICQRERDNRIKAFKLAARPDELDWLNARLEEMLGRQGSSGIYAELEKAREELLQERAKFSEEREKFRREREMAAAEIEAMKKRHREELAQANKNHAEQIRTLGEKTVEKGMKECKRMRLRAYELPCGTREACFRPKPCQNLPEGARLEEKVANWSIQEQ